jgi:membrane-associated phospholipid phosphatase
MTDQLVLTWLHSHHAPLLDHVFLASHYAGTTPALIVVAVAAIAWHLSRRERVAATTWTVVGLTTFTLDLGLKFAIARHRPDVPWALLSINEYSFPSGHAMGSAALFPLFVWTVAGAGTSRSAMWIALPVALSFVIGIGRIYLGVHWPTDVVAGWAIGFLILACAMTWLRSRRD